MGTIYILTNKINNKVYVGQTTQSFNKRFKVHKCSKTAVGNALRKYGVDNFKTTILENIEEKYLDDCEREFIKEYNSLAPNGYNLSSGGDSPTRGRHLSEETKRKISESNKGKHYQTEEIRRKISNASKGRVYGEKFRKNLAEKHSKKIICIETGIIYNSIKEVIKLLKIRNISQCCNGKRKTAGKLHGKFYV